MFETQGGTRKRTRDLPKKGSAFILSSDHWTKCAGRVKNKNRSHARRPTEAGSGYSTQHMEVENRRKTIAIKSPTESRSRGT